LGSADSIALQKTGHESAVKSCIASVALQSESLDHIATAEAPATDEDLTALAHSSSANVH
jgi:hypothetical protein